MNIYHQTEDYVVMFEKNINKINQVKTRCFSLISQLIFSLSMLFLFSNIAIAQPIASLDFSGDSPLYLSKEEIHEDLVQAEKFLSLSYARYSILEKAGVRWKLVFQRLENELMKSNTPQLTHHFQKQLIRALEFTEDSSLRADLFLKKRHYTQKVEPKVSFYTGVRMAQQNGRFRVLPESTFSRIINHWFIGCQSQQEVFFPILPNRQTESKFILGKQSNYQPKPFLCVFENDSGEKQELEIPLLLPETEINRPESPIFDYQSGRVPYVRWYRNGSSRERGVKQFLRVARKLRNTPILILDVRGNKNGSFAFIEQWFKILTKAHWKNVIVRERQTQSILKGLLNRVQWNAHLTSSRILLEPEQLEQKKQQLVQLIQYFEKKNIDQKWIETKFIFNGKDNAPAWKTRLIVVANQQCGDGCQFLAALAKQLPNATLIGSNTGPFPPYTSGPIYQLKNSRIMLSLNHRLHLNHLGKPVSPVGYLPDFWIFPPTGMSDILRYSGNRD